MAETEKGGTANRLAGLNLIQLSWMAPLCAVIIGIRRPTQDNSYLWHIEAGLRQLVERRVLTEDPFTFTAAGEPWRTQSWLLELGYGWFERFGPLVSGPVVIGISATVLLLTVGLRVAPGRGLLGPLGTVWVMWLTLGYFTARPVFMSLALFGLVLLVADHRRLRWAVPMLFWLWASIHGGFFIGLGYLVLQGLRHRKSSYFKDVAAGTVAATLTAHGWGVWEVLLNFSASRENLDRIAEWLPPDLISLPQFPFLLGLLWLLWLGATKRLATGDMWILLPFVAFAFTANRSVPMAAIAIAPIVFQRSNAQLGKKRFPVVVSGLTIAFIVILPFLVPIDEDGFRSRFPVDGFEHLDEVPTFHDDAVGGYLIYRRFPWVFIDDRAELFGEVYREFVDARSAKPGWNEVFVRFGLKQAIVRTGDPIGEVLTLSGWRSVYSDESFLILRE